MARGDFLDRGGLWVLAQIPLLLIAFVLPIWSGAGDPVPRGPVPIAGAAITVSGIFLTVWGLSSLGDALTPFPKPLANIALRRQGAYKYMRHPIYTGVMLGCLGWALWWLSGLGVGYALALTVFFDRKAAYEEQWLRARFPEYTGYAARVRRFLPGIY